MKNQLVFLLLFSSTTFVASTLLFGPDPMREIQKCVSCVDGQLLQAANNYPQVFNLESISSLPSCDGEMYDKTDFCSGQCVTIVNWKNNSNIIQGRLHHCLDNVFVSDYKEGLVDKTFDFIFYVQKCNEDLCEVDDEIILENWKGAGKIKTMKVYDYEQVNDDKKFNAIVEMINEEASEEDTKTTVEELVTPGVEDVTKFVEGTRNVTTVSKPIPYKDLLFAKYFDCVLKILTYMMFFYSFSTLVAALNVTYKEHKRKKRREAAEFLV